MKKHLRNREGQKHSHWKQLPAAFALWTLLLTIFPVSFLSIEIGQPPEGMVYCPLSKRFQPVNPPLQRKEPFSGICAGSKTKVFLFREIFINNIFKKVSLDEGELDRLAFDFLAHGKSAFEKLPNLPNSPSENLIRPISAGASSAGSSFSKNTIWKQTANIFALEFAARPPTVVESNTFSFNSIYQSKEISRRIAPRAPPTIFS
jgi:hypothetical protein